MSANYVPDDIDFSTYLDMTDAQSKVKPAATWIDDLKAGLHENITQKLIYLPWAKTMKQFHFREGEVTLWSGQNGHGKSLMTSQICFEPNRPRPVSVHCKL
jgi:twinkle protein